MIGQTFSHYRILEKLGGGGMGVVYKAADIRLKRSVALKFLPDELSRDRQALERFQREAQAASALDHPNICTIYDIGEHEGQPFIVMQYLEGQTLKHRIAGKALKTDELLELGMQIADALHAAHSRGIIHRDIKPANILVSRHGHAKILDFGLAKLTPKGWGAAEAVGGSVLPTASVEPEQLTSPGVAMGTVAYMSPEQARGEELDARTDLFSLGAVLYEMATGQTPFQGNTSAEIFGGILHRAPASPSQLNPKLPPKLEEIITRLLEKDRDLRYQSAADLRSELKRLQRDTNSGRSTVESGHSPAQSPSAGVQAISSGAAATATQASRGADLRSWLLVAGGVPVIAAAVFAYFLTRPLPVPKVSDYVQLTHDGQRKQIIATDGSRLYLLLGTEFSRAVGEISVSGGEPTRIPTPSPNMAPLALSPDGSELLLVDGKGDPPSGPLWGLAVLGGSPRRLGDTEGNSAAWSPDGKMLAYSNRGDLFLANADGSESRKLVTMKEPTNISDPVWSPDNTHLRFEAWDTVRAPGLLWEVSVDGTGLHRLLPGWSKPTERQCCGKWTADGKYYIFESRGQIWGLRRKDRLFSSEPKPIQLTFSPMSLGTPLPSKDRKKLFVVGRTFRGQLVRYDSKSGQFSPFLGGMSAEFVDFSKDGQWVAYVSYPGGNMWRSRADGSERLQLTYPPGYAVNPRWSPDGKKIVFFEMFADKPGKIFEVSPEEGSPRELMSDDANPQWDPNWSPDGSKIVFGGTAVNAASVISILDLATHKVSALPGSQGLYSPRWSPNGRYIAGLSADESILLLFDSQSQKWTELAKGAAAWPNFSKDGQYLYVLSSRGAGAVLKIRISDGKTEPVADLKNFVYTGHFPDSSLSLTPDDSLLLFRDAGTSDVYALDWEAP